MSCKNVCKLCKNLIISTGIAFTGGNLVITIPAGAYENEDIYCLVLAQSIPSTTTINAPVYVQIGTGTTLYPLTRRNCAQVTACGVRTRTRYRTRVVTTATGGSFRLQGDTCCQPNNNLKSITGTAPTTTAAVTATTTATTGTALTAGTTTTESEGNFYA
jgi:hypothetical protein